jgi:hypothetical protein
MIKIHIIRSAAEAANPLCSAPFVVQAFPGAGISEMADGPWKGLSELRGEAVDVNRWAFFCRAMECLDMAAPREKYRLAQVDGKRRLEVPAAFHLDGVVVSDAGSWEDWSPMLRANRWLADMRSYQLRSGDLREPIRFRGRRISLIYSMAMLVALLEHRPDIVDQAVEPYVRFRAESGAPSFGAFPGGWVSI